MPAALEALFRAYHRDVYHYLCHLTGDAALAEDLTAETFLAALTSLHRFRGECDEKTWLFSIARHKWSEHLRREKRSVPTVLLQEFLESPAPSPEDTAVTRDLSRRLQVLLSREPARSRQVMELHLAGYSFREIGQQLGITENSARVIAFRVKRKLKESIQEEESHRE